MRWVVALALVCTPLSVSAQDYRSTDPSASGTGTSIEYDVNGTRLGAQFSCDGGACGVRLSANEMNYHVFLRPGQRCFRLESTRPAQTERDGHRVHLVTYDPYVHDAHGFITDRYGYRTDHEFRLGQKLCAPDLGSPVTLILSKTLEAATMRGKHCIADRQPFARMCLEARATLTIFPSDPGNVFSPAYYGRGGWKEAIPASDFDPSDWPGYTKPEDRTLKLQSPGISPGKDGVDLPSFEEAFRILAWGNNDWFSKSSGEQNIGHAARNTLAPNGYNGNVAVLITQAIARLMTPPSTSKEVEWQRRGLLALFQQHIDILGVQLNSVDFDYAPRKKREIFGAKALVSQLAALSRDLFGITSNSAEAKLQNKGTPVGAPFEADGGFALRRLTLAYQGASLRSKAWVQTLNVYFNALALSPIGRTTFAEMDMVTPRYVQLMLPRFPASAGPSAGYSPFALKRFEDPAQGLDMELYGHTAFIPGFRAHTTSPRDKSARKQYGPGIPTTKNWARGDRTVLAVDHRSDGGSGAWSGCAPGYMPQIYERLKADVTLLAFNPRIQLNPPLWLVQANRWVIRVTDSGVVCDGAPIGKRLSQRKYDPFRTSNGRADPGVLYAAASAAKLFVMQDPEVSPDPRTALEIVPRADCATEGRNRQGSSASESAGYSARCDRPSPRGTQKRTRSE